MFYVILEAANEPSEVAKLLLKKGFKPTVVMEKKAFNEHLFVVKFSRKIKNLKSYFCNKTNTKK